MQILIKEENGFMPTTRINIHEDKIEVEENNKLRKLKYDKYQIREIMQYLLELFKSWKNKYVDEKIIDDDIYTITIVTRENKEFYIRNKYPNNWAKFIEFRNKLVRESLNV